MPGWCSTAAAAGPVMDTLNQIVRQTAPHTWVVTTRKEGDAVRIVGFGFLNAAGGRRTQPMPGS